MLALKSAPSTDRSDLSPSAHRIYCRNLSGRFDEECLTMTYRQAMSASSWRFDIDKSLSELRGCIREVRAKAVLLEELDLRDHVRADRLDDEASGEWRRHKAAVRAERSAHKTYYNRQRRRRHATVVECHRCGRRTMQHVEVSTPRGGLVAMSPRCASLWARGDRGRHAPRPVHPAQLTFFP